MATALVKTRQIGPSVTCIIFSAASRLLLSCPKAISLIWGRIHPRLRRPLSPSSTGSSLPSLLPALTVQSPTIPWLFCLFVFPRGRKQELLFSAVPVSLTIHSPYSSGEIKALRQGLCARNSDRWLAALEMKWDGWAPTPRPCHGSPFFLVGLKRQGMGEGQSGGGPHRGDSFCCSN